MFAYYQKDITFTKQNIHGKKDFTEVFTFS